MDRNILAQGGIVLAAFVASVVVFGDLPNEMAIHWGAGGSADGFASRSIGAFFLPVIMAGLLVLFRAIPGIDPLGGNYATFKGYYEAFVTITLVFVLYVHGLVLVFNLGYEFDLVGMIIPAVGLLVYGVGIVVENAERNWFVGIRTPWTLSNEEVWDRTHQVGAPLFKVSGVIALGGIFVPEYAVYFLAGPLAITALVTTLYSYYVYRSLDGSPDAMSA